MAKKKTATKKKTAKKKTGTATGFPTRLRFPTYVQSIAVAPDSSTILLANSSYSRLGFARRGIKGVEEVEVRGSPVGLVLSPDCAEVAFAFGGFSKSGGGRQRPGLAICDAATGAEKHVIEGIADDSQALAWSPDGRWLAVVYYPERLDLFSVEEVRAGRAEPARTVTARSSAVIQFARDKRAVLQADDGKLVHYDIDGAVSERLLPGYSTAAEECLAVGPRGYAYPTGVIDDDGGSVWQNTDLYCEKVAFSPDGSRLVCAAAAATFYEDPPQRPKGMENGFVAAHDATTGKRLGFVPRVTKREARALAVTDELVVVGTDSYAEVYSWSDLA